MFSLLHKNLIAAYFCCVGWLDEKGMIVSVKVGFMYMEIFTLFWVLCMEMSR